MVVIVAVLGIALTIFTNVLRSSLSARKLRAQAILDQATLQAGQHPEQVPADTLSSGWQLVQESRAYEAGSRLQLVHLSLYDENHALVAEASTIIINPKANGTAQD